MNEWMNQSINNSFNKSLSLKIDIICISYVAIHSLLQTLSANTYFYSANYAVYVLNYIVIIFILFLWSTINEMVFVDWQIWKDTIV